jgi:hypothetical protein
MNRVCGAVIALLAVAAPVRGQQAPADTLVVRGGGRASVVTARVLDSLATDTVRAGTHGRSPDTYVGVGLDRVLAWAGVPVAGLRGREFERVVVVTAHDGYRMVFGIGEIDRAVTGRVIVLTRAASPADGPWRLVVPGDQRGARWVRQVADIAVQDVPR